MLDKISFTAIMKPSLAAFSIPSRMKMIVAIYFLSLTCATSVALVNGATYQGSGNFRATYNLLPNVTHVHFIFSGEEPTSLKLYLNEVEIFSHVVFFDGPKLETLCPEAFSGGGSLTVVFLCAKSHTFTLYVDEVPPNQLTNGVGQAGRFCPVSGDLFAMPEYKFRYSLATTSNLTFDVDAQPFREILTTLSVRVYRPTDLRRYCIHLSPVLLEFDYDDNKDGAVLANAIPGEYIVYVKFFSLSSTAENVGFSVGVCEGAGCSIAQADVNQGYSIMCERPINGTSTTSGTVTGGPSANSGSTPSGNSASTITSSALYWLV